MVNQTFRDVGINPVPSVTNFVFADIGRDAKAFRQAMANEGVLINGGYAGCPNYIRVSMGKLEDLETFDRVFKRVFARAV